MQRSALQGRKQGQPPSTLAERLAASRSAKAVLTLPGFVAAHRQIRNPVPGAGAATKGQGGAADEGPDGPAIGRPVIPPNHASRPVVEGRDWQVRRHDSAGSIGSL